MTSFDEGAWRIICENAAAQASQGTGLVYELYQQNLNGLIRARVTGIEPAHQALALQVAADDFGYSEHDEVPGEGECMHFLDPRWCPVGCGDLDAYS